MHIHKKYLEVRDYIETNFMVYLWKTWQLLNVPKTSFRLHAMIVSHFAKPSFDIQNELHKLSSLFNNQPLWDKTQQGVM